MLIGRICTPTDIRHPIDLSLVNDARELTETLIDAELLSVLGRLVLAGKLQYGVAFRALALPTNLGCDSSLPRAVASYLGAAPDSLGLRSPLRWAGREASGALAHGRCLPGADIWSAVLRRGD